MTPHAVAENLAVVILTLNEELNLPHAIGSVRGIAGEILVVDSGSSDRTEEIARENGCRFVFRRFDNYSAQRNFAISAVAQNIEWIFFVDADESITDELADEISRVVVSSPVENGFMIKFRLMWLGRWIRHGYYPTWILRLFRREFGRCDNRGVNEHMVVGGKIGRLENDLVHEDRKGIADWISKHNRYADFEARLLLEKLDERKPARFFSTQSERKKWFRQRVWARLPPLLRPFCYFTYRYVLRGGFLDGIAGLSYHFMQALWYQMLIDMKYLEMRRNIKP